MQNFDKSVTEIEKIIGYTFIDKSLLKQAFTRTSYCNEHKMADGVKLQSNEVLEFFGDGVLSVAIISFMLKKCTERYAYGIKTDLSEGDFSNIKSKLSDKKNLSARATALGLGKYLNMGEGDAKLGIENEPSVMEDLFESIIGAVYIDCGMSIPTVMRVVERMLDVGEYISRTPPIQSSKNALQEWCADKKRRLPTPSYKTISEDGPDHKKTYVRGCYIGERLVAKGIGKNLKLADASAAESALGILIAEEQNKEAAKKLTESKKVAESKKHPQKKKSESKKPEEKSKTPPKKKSTAPKQSAEKNATPKQASEPKVAPKQAAHPQKSSPKGAGQQKKPTRQEGKRQTIVGKTDEPKQPTTKKNSTRVGTSGQVAAKKTSESAIVFLKNYAQSEHIATPAFKDLGEVRGKGGQTEYRIECRFAGRVATATAKTRTEARELAALTIKESLTKKRKPHPAKRKNKPKN